MTASKQQIAPATSNNLLAPEERQQLINVLQSSLYVGCKPESIQLVLDYCLAAKLDPMQKPVHIVPMNTRDPVTGNYEWRDVVMPGIGLYRIQADRSGTMAGMSEPEFGPEITREFTDKHGKKVTVTFPEWCKVTVQKLVADRIVEFSAKEYWLENYATDSSKSDAPNAMWRKRPRGQIAKCAEAQALRKGWPEICAAPTAEEMEGKTLGASVERDITGQVEVVEEPASLDEALQIIAECRTEAELKGRAAKVCAELPDDDQAEARKAYKARLHELRTQEQQQPEEAAA